MNEFKISNIDNIEAGIKFCKSFGVLYELIIDRESGEEKIQTIAVRDIDKKNFANAKDTVRELGYECFLDHCDVFLDNDNGAVFAFSPNKDVELTQVMRDSFRNMNLDIRKLERSIHKEAAATFVVRYRTIRLTWNWDD